MSLHELCLHSLNHEITQALACSLRLERTHFSQLLANFGLLHFFVVSGAHLNIILFFFNRNAFLNRSLWLKHTVLFAFVTMCNYSPPIFRVFLYQIIKNVLKKHFFFTPTLAVHFLSYLICLLMFAKSNALIFSASLSFTFSFLIFLARRKNKKNLSLRFYLLSFPFFLFVFGVPHISTLVITPLTAFLLGGLLLPASLLSLIYEPSETLTIQFWWWFQDFIKFTAVYFNFPKKLYWDAEFIDSKQLIAFNCFSFLLTSIGIVLWRRKSYSFS